MIDLLSEIIIYSPFYSKQNIQKSQSQQASLNLLQPTVSAQQ